MTKRAELGAFGERVAGHRLAAAGLTIVARNVRVPGGEIDLVCRDGTDTVCVEVRTRRSHPGAAAESLTPTKRARMWRAAFAYAEREGIDPAHLRIDLLVIDLAPNGAPAHIDLLCAIEMGDG
ncbi:MAG: YraN family protein [Dehalococcoidia bacterium]